MKIIAVLVLALAALVASDDINWRKLRPAWRMPRYWQRLPKEVMKQMLSELKDLPKNRPEGRIVGGYHATPGQFPYQVVMISQFPQGGALCGGSVLSQNFVLTAAHCVDQASGGTVILGAHDRTNAAEVGQVRIPFVQSGIYLHQNWDPSLIRYDIATVRLQSPVTYSDRIQPVNLPRWSDVANDFAGVTGTVSGFGRFSDAVDAASDTLRYVTNPIQTNTACNIRFLGLIQPENICLSGENGRGACSIR
ncbi:chymotrypsin BI-like isoform X1 [Topomyia yanbarensis]|uniref:chymotrypsin BI-like isoform X1 n=1 Tax=Topomyia yanbarensis TaxID=2498891 RepID=UPI00273C1434|nr:chymotrypsin BI-like isoform X1 [Topomyia yanbarensis]